MGLQFLCIAGGVGRGNWRLHYWACTPPRKIRAQFRGHKNTSLISFVDEAGEPLRLLRSETKVRNVVLTLGRRQWNFQLESLPIRCRIIPHCR